MVIRLVLCNRKYDADQPYYYIGRPSPLGNPFRVTVQTITNRNNACDKYHEYFYREIANFQNELDYLIHLTTQYGILQLVCFCSPLRCHGDTVIEYLKQELLKLGYDVVIERNQNAYYREQSS